MRIVLIKPLAEESVTIKQTQRRKAEDGIQRQKDIKRRQGLSCLFWYFFPHIFRGTKMFLDYICLYLLAFLIVHFDAMWTHTNY